MSLSFYQQLEWRLEHAPMVVATVIRTDGTLLQPVGTKMAIDGDRPIIGSIGGGIGEAHVIQVAHSVLATGCSQLVDIYPSETGVDNDAIQVDPPVAPERWSMQVWVERWSLPWALPLTHDICHRLHAHQTAWLVTPLVADIPPFLRIDPPEANAPPSVESFSLSGITIEALIEPLLPPPVLLIVGASHVGVALAEVAHMAGFRVYVQDGRSDSIRPDRLPLGTHVYPMALSDALPYIPRTSQMYVVLTTQNYREDVDALAEMFDRFAPVLPRYVGIAGDQRHFQGVTCALDARGLSVNQFPSLQVPVGIDFGASTPAEIAIGIGAELIQIRRGGFGLSAADAEQAIAPHQNRRKFRELY